MRYLTYSLKHFHSSMACSLFQLVLKRTSAILDADLHPAHDGSARSPDLLLLQGILLLLHSGDQILQGGGVGAGLPCSSATARTSSPGATGHPAMVARRHYYNVGRNAYIDSYKPSSSRWCEGGHQLVRLDAAIRVTEWLEGKFGDRRISRFSGRPWPSHTPDTLNPPALIF